MGPDYSLWNEFPEEAFIVNFLRAYMSQHLQLHFEQQTRSGILAQFFLFHCRVQCGMAKPLSQPSADSEKYSSCTLKATSCTGMWMWAKSRLEHGFTRSTSKAAWNRLFFQVGVSAQCLPLVLLTSLLHYANYVVFCSGAKGIPLPSRALKTVQS